MNDLPACRGTPLSCHATRRSRRTHHRNADHIPELGVSSLYLFGSTARDEARADSDVDIFVDVESGASFSLFELIELKDRLEATLGVNADVMTRRSLHHVLRDQIVSEAVRVF